MKINFLQNTISFESKKLYTARIQQQKSGAETREPVDIFITGLNKKDLSRLRKDRYTWRKTHFGNDIIRHLRLYDSSQKKAGTPEYFFAIEVPQKGGKRKICALALVSTFSGMKITTLDFLQTKKFSKNDDKLFGAGSCLLYAAIDRAGTDGSRNFALSADKEAVDFYRKNGIPEEAYNNFRLEKDGYSHVLEKLKNKSSIKKIEK